MNILFVCSKNKWRSRTAETIFKDSVTHDVKSAGTNQGARVKLTEKHLIWADKIFVMEKKHLQIIKQKFHVNIDREKVIVLNIPDEYEYMDEELILLLKNSIAHYMENTI